MGYVKSSFNTMRLIVTAGWCIYPLGYFFGYLMGAVNDDALNLVYNLADFSTRLGFAWPSGRLPRQTLWRKSTRRGCLVETWVCPSLASSNCPAACKVNLE